MQNIIIYLITAKKEEQYVHICTTNSPPKEWLRVYFERRGAVTPKTLETSSYKVGNEKK